jgi:ubiquinone/menaquinone biosynthesis C-methylase UbiE
MSDKAAESRWTEAADAWARWASVRAAMIPATETMLDLAHLGPGQHVLDVGCGSGEQTVMAARRVGPSGTVVATDIATAMIAATDKTIAEAGLTNVSTRVCAVEALAGEGERYDAAICRLVLMLVPDPVAAAHAVCAVLRPGGRFAALVHGDPQRNPMNRLAIDILARHGGKTVRRDGPGFFALADPARLADVMHHAGFVDVMVTQAPATRRLDDAATAVTMIRQSFADCMKLVADLPAEGQAAAWEELRQALAAFEGPDGCVMPAEYNIVVGRRPAG